MKTKILLFLLSAGQSFPDTLADKDWPKVYLGYKKEYHTDSLGKKEEIVVSDQGSFHHGIKLFLYPSQVCSTFAFPVFIKGRDTIFSASDGGFFRGPCKYELNHDSMKIHGKYSRLTYARMKDSSYTYKLKAGKRNLYEKRLGILFKPLQGKFPFENK